MSESATTQMPTPNQQDNPPPELRPESVLGLLKEYSEKLSVWVQRAAEIKAAAEELQALPLTPPEKAKLAAYRDEAQRLWMKWIKLQPAAEELARYASSMIENTRLDAIRRVELRLRLAEYEGMLESSWHITPLA